MTLRIVRSYEPPTHHDGPVTEKASARRRALKDGSYRYKILRYLDSAGTAGGTCMEIAEHWGISPHYLSSIFGNTKNSLEKHGLIRRTGEIRGGGEVWRITEAGLMALEETK